MQLLRRAICAHACANAYAYACACVRERGGGDGALRARAVVNIVRQGRSALVTTMQMYKILALSCLISAYCLSVLYLDGIKFGDTYAS
jgi:hypothetical protein